MNFAITPTDFIYQGSAGGDLGGEIFAAGAGMMIIQDGDGKQYSLTYAQVGASASAIPGIDFSSFDMPSVACGIIQISGGLQSPDDFVGAFRMFSASGISGGMGAAAGWIIFGGSNTALLAVAATMGAAAVPAAVAEMACWKGGVPIAGVTGGSPNVGVTYYAGVILSCDPYTASDDGGGGEQSNDPGTQPSQEGGVGNDNDSGS